MDVLSTAVNAAVVATVGLVLAWLGKGRFDAIDHRFESQDRRIERLEQGLEHGMDAVGHKIDGRMDGLRASIDALRSDLTQVALAVGARRRATNA